MKPDPYKTADGRWKVCPLCGSRNHFCRRLRRAGFCPPASKFRDPPPMRAPGERPRRIQLSRAKGWRKPPGTIVVARPSKWGNPHKLSDHPHRTPEIVTRRYRGDLEALLAKFPELLEELRDYDLACWCPLDQPCHADVLLELANPPISAPRGKL